MNSILPATAVHAIAGFAARKHAVGFSSGLFLRRHARGVKFTLDLGVSRRPNSESVDD
jgi:hypothetical protein